MKIRIPIPTEFDAVAIRCTMPVDSEDREGLPGDCPGLDGDMMRLTLDLDTRKVRDWPPGRRVSIHIKPVDRGTYELLDASGEVIDSIVEDYVPGCVPGSFGDYFEADVAEDGTVLNWRPSVGRVIESFNGGQA